MDVDGPVVILVPVDYSHDRLLMEPLHTPGEISPAA